MAEHTGWLLDVYPDEKDSVVLWLLGEDGVRYRFIHDFPITFYAAGPFDRLRALWNYLQSHPIPSLLTRMKRRDLFRGPVDVLAVQVNNMVAQRKLFYKVRRHFPDLIYYDADLELHLHYGATYGVFPMARCRIDVNQNGEVQSISVLDSQWELDPDPLPLRVMTIQPDVDPAHASPSYLHIVFEGRTRRLKLKPQRLLLDSVARIINRFDPDLILINWGDTWLFPYLLDLAADYEIPFNPNRDQERDVLQRKELSYFTYGQVLHRGRQVHLFGRWHIDRCNGMMYGDHGIEGILEQARVTAQPVQISARKSPGSGISAMQMTTALRQGILVPYQKQQAEDFKTAGELMRADWGGMVYQPLVGLHRDVAEIDFISMYPSIMVNFNVSPETVGVHADGQPIPDLEISVERKRMGLVSETLRPLLAKRIALKERLNGLSRADARYASLEARISGLKWLLVVCFGYLGYKNARFGRIEAHTAVTAYGREALLQAKEAAEKMGFTVLHMYVDALWVKKVGASQVADFQPLLDEVLKRTGLPIALEGIYRWLAFLPSRVDKRVSVANRYFGIFQDGRLKIRGIEARRRDTPTFIRQAQMDILHSFVQAADGERLADCLPGVIVMLRKQLAELRAGRVPLVDLLVKQSLSRELEEYRTPSASARAATQLKGVGKLMRPGQSVRFIYTRGRPGVYAWDLPDPLNPAAVNISRYGQLLVRAAHAVLQPLGVGEDTLRDWLFSSAGYVQHADVAPEEPSSVFSRSVERLPLWKHIEEGDEPGY
ncbi:MAG: hypothetical protein FVQ83_11605 [Chloroflexi bacterium]|nr:hypothetical protein [Chloroflexota bacterium]